MLVRVFCNFKVMSSANAKRIVGNARLTAIEKVASQLHTLTHSRASTIPSHQSTICDHREWERSLHNFREPDAGI
jgi:hypothetical protein